MKKHAGETRDVELQDLPPIDAAQREQLDALARMPDSDIDKSDIAPLTDVFFARAVRNPLYRPLKRQLTLRLDADVLAWLKASGRGYQTRINRILRLAMTHEIGQSATKVSETGSRRRG